MVAATIQRMTWPRPIPPRRPRSQAKLGRSRMTAATTAAIQSGAATRKNASDPGPPRLDVEADEPWQKAAHGGGEPFAERGHRHAAGRVESELRRGEVQQLVEPLGQPAEEQPEQRPSGPAAATTSPVRSGQDGERREVHDDQRGRPPAQPRQEAEHEESPAHARGPRRRSCGWRAGRDCPPRRFGTWLAVMKLHWARNRGGTARIASPRARRAGPGVAGARASSSRGSAGR